MEENNFNDLNDIEKAIDEAHTFDGKPISEHDREVVRNFLIEKYLKEKTPLSPTKD